MVAALREASSGQLRFPGSMLPRPRALHWPVARRCGRRCRMPGQSGFGPQAQPAPDYEFDRRFAWQGRLDEDPLSLAGERSCLGPSNGPPAAGRL